jgi:hypothetical protein
MDDLTEKIGIGGGAGIVGAILSWLGFKYRIDNMQKDVETLKKEVRYQDTCLEVHKAVDARLQNIEDMQKEMRDDIKALIQRE